MAFLGLLGLVLLAYLFISPVYFFLRLRRMEKRIAELEAGSRSSVEASDNKPASQVQAKDMPSEPVAAPDTEDPVETTTSGPDIPDTPPESPWDAATKEEAAHSAPEPRKPRRSLEETLASQWMIWLGGLAVALSAVFLFTYAVDQGWLTPMTRVVLGLLLGGALLAAGEWTLKHPVEALVRADKTDFVPPALTASGLFAIFAALFAAYALFDLLTPATAFVALGLTSYAALGLALRQGWFVALLGIVAGFGMPALIEATDPQAMPVFLYLFMLSAGAIALTIWRAWRWFSILLLIGSFFWPIAWTVDYWNSADQGVIGAYTLGLAALYGAFAMRLPVKLPGYRALRWLLAVVTNMSGLGFALSGLVLMLLAEVSDYNTAAGVLSVIYAALALALSYWRSRLEGLVVVAALIAILSLLAWPEPYIVSPPEVVERLGTGSYATAFGPYVVPPEFASFARSLWAMAAVFGLGGFYGLRRARTQAIWAGAAGAVPVLLFVLAYARIGKFEIDVQWASLATALAAAYVVGCFVAARMLAPERRDVPVSLLAAAATAALALAFTCLLREAWLTVAIAMEVLALAWIWTRSRVNELRWVATAVLTVVLVRLLLNPMVADYDSPGLMAFSWVLYGYGLPALAIWIAGRLFAKGGRGLVVIFCEVSALGLAFVMVALQLKIWTSGAVTLFDLSLLDQSVQVVWWLCAALMLLGNRTVARFAWSRWAGLVVLAAAVLLLVFGPVLNNNPLASPGQVGRLPGLNLLALAYLVPAIQLFVLGRREWFTLPEVAARACPVASGALIFLYLTLETRRMFQGSVIEMTHATQPSGGEIYAYSAVWILYALAILALGIRLRSVALRYASLAVLIVTVAKVFLYDMSDLTGLYRVASFLGLGLTLIGIGRVYQKYVFTPKPHTSDPDDPNTQK